MVRGRSARRSLAAGVLAAALLLVAGCTGSTTKDPGPTTTAASSSPTPTPSPTPTEAVDVTVEPERPPAMDAPPTPEGAVAVAEYFTLLYPYVYATGDLSAWNELSHPECKFCESVTTNVEAMFGSGGHSVGGAATILSSSNLEVNPGVAYAVTLDVSEEPSSTRNSQGTVVEDFPGVKKTRSTVIVHWEDGGWAIRGVDVEDVAQ